MSPVQFVRDCPHFHLVAVNLEELSAVHVVGGELRDVLLHAEPSQPLAHLLGGPRRHGARGLLKGLPVGNKREDVQNWSDTQSPELWWEKLYGKPWREEKDELNRKRVHVCVCVCIHWYTPPRRRTVTAFGRGVRSGRRSRGLAEGWWCPPRGSGGRTPH